jgi:two-component system cell cycle response regulator
MTARILLVRDGDMPAATVERVLARDYAAVEAAADWSAAEAALAAEPFDLVIVGAGGDGEAAGAFVRALRHDARHEALPVVVSIQVPTPAAAIAAYAAGADAVIGPHPDTVLLGARLRFLLRQHGLFEELRLRERASERLGIRLSPTAFEAAPLPRRLLVLTDDGKMAPALEGALAAAGFAASAAIARPLLSVPPPDAGPELVLIDVTRADPLAMAARFRQMNRRRPVAIAHEVRDPFRAVRALDLGIAEPLPRPLEPGVTAAALLRMAERQALLDRLRRHHAESLDLAVTDPLTGVFNRRYLEAYFELQKRGAQDGAFALLLLDVDRFKQINDRLGHAGGDAALSQIAERLLGHVRASDMVVRVGGEEFVVLMPGADRATAETVAERLRAVVADKPFTVVGEKIAVTISVGIAIGAVAGSRGLLAEADVALYASKRKGRNCVTAAPKAGVEALPAPVA